MERPDGFDALPADQNVRPAGDEALPEKIRVDVALEMLRLLGEQVAALVVDEDGPAVGEPGFRPAP